MIQNATEVRLIIHFKILENNADLEAKAHFCIISLKVNSLSIISCKGMEQKLEVDFEKWLKVMIFHYPFKILEKIIVRQLKS
jgi:hypothetical protein